MDERNNDFDFDFMPIGQAIKKAREARGMLSKTRENIQASSCLFSLLQCSMFRLMSIYFLTKKSKRVPSADA